ncbi:hypothetical protein Tco_0574968 [Tanacetum coccineum]
MDDHLAVLLIGLFFCVNETADHLVVFSMKVFHGGTFTPTPNRRELNNNAEVVDLDEELLVVPHTRNGKFLGLTKCRKRLAIEWLIDNMGEQSSCLGGVENDVVGAENDIGYENDVGDAENDVGGYENDVCDENYEGHGIENVKDNKNIDDENVEGVD